MVKKKLKSKPTLIVVDIMYMYYYIYYVNYINCVFKVMTVSATGCREVVKYFKVKGIYHSSLQTLLVNSADTFQFDPRVPIHQYIYAWSCRSSTSHVWKECIPE